MQFPEVFKRYFHHGHHVVSSEYIENTRKIGNNVIEMCQAFHVIAQFECFTDLNLFKYMHSMSFKTGKWFLYNFI